MIHATVNQKLLKVQMEYLFLDNLGKYKEPLS